MCSPITVNLNWYLFWYLYWHTGKKKSQKDKELDAMIKRHYRSQKEVWRQHQKEQLDLPAEKHNRAQRWLQQQQTDSEHGEKSLGQISVIDSMLENADNNDDCNRTDDAKVDGHTKVEAPLSLVGDMFNQMRAPPKLSGLVTPVVSVNNVGALTNASVDAFPSNKPSKKKQKKRILSNYAIQQKREKEKKKYQKELEAKVSAA